MSTFKPQQPQLQLTEDGSHTLFLSDLNETYHSSAGALTESLHVFIDYGLHTLKHLPEISLLEVGFGTGLNAILSLERAEENKQMIHYFSLEPYPIDIDLASKLDLGYISKSTWLKELWLKMHQAEMNETIRLSPFFYFTKLPHTIQAFESANERFDLLYYDAFAPRKQPEMWEISTLQKCASLLKSKGVFITYCANGQFKRDMKSLGFTLFNPPGIKGRKEITQATKG
jgi:tRNA U34 5-methylaminomethyl-2-thiouridine-forming methyltransferase MnmC